MLPDSAVTCHEVPAAEAYWTDQPVTSTAAAEVFRSSMKSLVRVAPELPPPPYTWLMTTSGDTAVAGAAVSATAPPRTRTDTASAATRGEVRTALSSHVPPVPAR